MAVGAREVRREFEVVRSSRHGGAAVIDRVRRQLDRLFAMPVLPERDPHVEERLAEAVQQVRVLRDLVGQLEPQLQRAAVGVADLGGVGTDGQAIERSREGHPEPRLGRMRGREPLSDRDGFPIRHVGRPSVGAVVQIAEPVPDLGLTLQQGDVIRPVGQRLVVQLGGPSGRRASLLPIVQVREDLPNPRLGRGQVGQDGRIIPASSQDLRVEVEGRFEEIPAERPQPRYVQEALSLTLVKESSTALRARARLACDSVRLAWGVDAGHRRRCGGPRLHGRPDGLRREISA